MLSKSCHDTLLLSLPKLFCCKCNNNCQQQIQQLTMSTNVLFTHLGDLNSNYMTCVKLVMKKSLYKFFISTIFLFFPDLPCEQRQTVPARVRHQVWRYLHPQLQVLTLFLNKGYLNPINLQSWILLTLFLCRQETKQECGTVTETTNEKVCDGASEPKCSVQNVKECVVKNEQQCQSVNDRWGLDYV